MRENKSSLSHIKINFYYLSAIFLKYTNPVVEITNNIIIKVRLLLSPVWGKSVSSVSGFCSILGFSSVSGFCSVPGFSSVLGLKSGSNSPQLVHEPFSKLCDNLGIIVPFSIISVQSGHTLSPVYPSSVQVASFAFVIIKSLECLHTLSITLPLSSSKFYLNLINNFYKL